MNAREGNPLVPQDRGWTIAIASTFTAEPVVHAIDFWMHELGFRSRIEFAPFNQVVQQLLDPCSLLHTNHVGANILLVRSVDWVRAMRGCRDELSTIEVETDVERKARDFVEAVRSFTQKSTTPLVVLFCPNPDLHVLGPKLGSVLAGRERWVKDQLSGDNAVQIITSEELAFFYPVPGYYDRVAEKENGLPYGQVSFASIGTMIARALFRLQCRPYKAIVLDCDRTLWNGVCAEDGPSGIAIDAPYRYLQQFMKRQAESGMLLCLCSKNIPDDVLRVFRTRADMPLRIEHIASSRINWDSKSNNVRSLAEELDLDLASMIFVDDSPVDCAEMKANCPDVLTLELPADSDQIPVFLNHLWALDRVRITEEDRHRTFYYQQEQRRSSARQSLGLRDFFATLDLRVQISEARSEHLPRIAQLAERTNQFNVTAARHSEPQIRELWRSHDLLAVEVEDRYGDYGLVGVVAASRAEDALVVDTFLLSCRALGRGVEHQMLAKLGQIARDRHIEFVLVPYIESPRNLPALQFLRNVPGAPPDHDGQTLRFRFPSEQIAELKHSCVDAPEQISSLNDVSPTLTTSKLKPVTGPNPGSEHATAFLSRTAQELNEPTRILRAITEWNRKARPAIGPAFVPPEGPIEIDLAQIWADTLGIDSVSAADNFFALGGHSLVAVQIAFQIRQHFGLNFSLREFLDVPVLRSQAQRIEQGLFEEADASEVELALRETDFPEDTSS